jgi:hypothetical protein
MQAKSEVVVKFSGSLPEGKPAANKKVEISLTDQNGVVFTALVNVKSWRKAEANTAEYADWTGALSGKLGPRTEEGFEVIDAGLQIFEKKAKVDVPGETASEVAVAS